MIVFVPIFPKMADWQALAERSQLAATVPRKFEQAWIILHTSVQYKLLSTLSDKARNRLKGEFYDGPDLPTVKSIGYNGYNGYNAV